VASSFFLIVRQVDGLGMNAYQVKTEKSPACSVGYTTMT